MNTMPTEVIDNHDEIFIETSRVQKALASIRLLHKYGRQRSESHCLMMTGPSRIGKSTIIERYMVDYPEEWVPEQGYKRPVVCVTPEYPGTLKILSSAILYALGGSHLRGESQVDMTRRVVHLLKEQKVGLLIIDEAHHLIGKDNRRVVWDAGEWLKTLLNRNVCPILLSGLPQTKRLLEVNEQLAGRCDGHVKIQPFDFSREEDRDEFREILSHLLDALPSQDGLNLLSDDLFVRLFLLMKGHVGFLRNFIRHAYTLSAESGSSGLTWEALVAAADNLVVDSPEIAANPFRFDDGRLKSVVDALA